MKKDLNFTERAVPGVTANFLMEEARARYHFAAKYTDSLSVVCDMACGTGYGSEILGRKVQQVIGLDISDEALEFAQINFSKPNVSFLKMDVAKTMFKDKAFTVITAFEMIEHLTKTSIFLKEVTRILAPRGVFVVSTPNRLTQSPDGAVMSPYHTKEYSPVELQKLLHHHFSSVELFGQKKNHKAEDAVRHFMFSQKVRQFFVDIDILNLRKLLTRSRKEELWSRIGGLFGRHSQNKIGIRDYSISKRSLDSCEYLIAVCRK